MKTDKQGRYTATGKRKTSVARVILAPGEGKVLCNGRSAEEYFGRAVLVTTALKPLVDGGDITEKEQFRLLAQLGMKP